MFDMIAAGVAAEVEADASGSKGIGGSETPNLSRDAKAVLAERIAKQEEIRQNVRRVETKT